MGKKKYKAAVIGCGRIAGFLEDDKLRDTPCSHAGAYTLSKNIDLVACASRTQKSADKFAKRFAIPASYSDYKTMLKVEKPDIVSICTTAETHAEIVKAAAKAKVKSIFCEKAMATSIAEADSMVRACKRHGSILTINHTRRWMSEFMTVKKMIDSGKIGRLQTISGFFGGNIIHTGTHFFDMACYFAGRPLWVTAELKGVKKKFLKNTGYLNWGNREIKDSDGNALIGFENDVTVTVCGVGKEYFLFEMDIQGSKGRIRIGNNGVYEFYQKRKSSNYTGFTELVRKPFPSLVKPKNGWFTICDDLVTSVKGKPSRSPGEAARNSLEIALAMHVSHNNKAEKVRLPLARKYKNIRIISK